MVYDPKAAHDYYIRTRKLKGRKKGSSPPSTNDRTSSSVAKPSSGNKPSSANSSASSGKIAEAKTKVVRLKEKVNVLQGALSKALAALSEQRQAAIKTKKASSDGKSTAQEKQSSQEYRDKNQAKIAAKDKATSGSTSGGTSKSTSSSSSSSSPPSVEELESRIIRIRSALTDAKKLLSEATQNLGQLTHSAITSEPTINDQFARYRSEERTLSHDSSGSGLHRLRDA